MIRRLTLTAALSLCLALSGTVTAQRGAQGSTHSSAGAKSGGSSKPVHVKAYTKKDGTHVKEYDRSAPDRERSEPTSDTTSASDDEYIGLLGLTQTQIQLQFGSPSSTSGDTWYYEDSSGRLQMSFTNGVVSSTMLPADFDVPFIPRIKAPAPVVSLPPTAPIAKCGDGSYVVTADKNGLCYGHGGVAQKLTSRRSGPRM